MRRARRRGRAHYYQRGTRKHRVHPVAGEDMPQWNGWTDELRETVQRLYLDGYTLAQIADEIRAPTKNMVAGMVNRLGLFRTPKNKRAALRAAALQGIERKRVPPVQKKRVRKDVKTPPWNPAANVAPSDNVVPFPEPLPPPPPPEPREPREPRFLIEARAGRCRYPIAGQGISLMVCHRVVQPGSSYCPECHRLTHVRAHVAEKYERQRAENERAWVEGQRRGTQRL